MFNTLQVKCLGLILSNGFLKSKTYFYNKGLSLFLNCTVPLFILHYVGTVTFFYLHCLGSLKVKFWPLMATKASMLQTLRCKNFVKSFAQRKCWGGLLSCIYYNTANVLFSSAGQTSNL